MAQKCYCGSANCRGYLGQSKTTGQFRGGGGGRLPRGDIGSPREAGGGGGGWRRRHTARADNREDSMVRTVLLGLLYIMCGATSKYVISFSTLLFPNLV